MRVLYAAILVAFLTACSTVKDAGVGMSTAAPSASHFGNALGFGGLILDVGSDIFKPTLTGDELADKAARKWKGHGITATTSLNDYIKGSVSQSLTDTIDKVKTDVKNGRFTGMGLQAYVSTMGRYDKGEWISVTYPNDKIDSGGLVLQCNKASKNCILSLKDERVVLPALRASTVTLQKIIGDKRINVGAFTAFEPKLSKRMCRMVTPINSWPVEGALTFADIPRIMLTKEMIDVSAFDAKAPLTLTGNLKSFDFSSQSGSWDITLEVMSSNGKSMRVTEKYNFETGFGGQAACNSVQQALAPAMQELVSKILSDSAFPSLIDVGTDIR